jgi:hypothetical protein
MGAGFSAFLAQVVTWCLLENVMKKNRVTVVTMIDNVIFASDSEEIAEEIMSFAREAGSVGLHFNDVDCDLNSRTSILEKAERNARDGVTLLGEIYRGEYVYNTPEHLTKADAMISELEGGKRRSKRNICGLISLMCWIADTVDVHMCSLFALVKLWSDTVKLPVTWDTLVTLTKEEIASIRETMNKITQKQHKHKVEAFPAIKPEEEEAYDFVALVDASASGWGAIVKCKNGEIWFFRQGFHKLFLHSAWSEPLGATEMLRTIKEKFGMGHIAVVSDHHALTGAQRRPISGNAGFSAAFYLNSFYECLYEFDPNAHIFYVEGEQNPADDPSRSSDLHDPLLMEKCAINTFPPLNSFENPYICTSSKKRWFHV